MDAIGEPPPVVVATVEVAPPPASRGPFVWLLITSVSYQRNLLARPLALIPPEVTFDNYRMVLGMVRFHAEGQAAKILPSMLNSLIVAAAVTGVNLVIGTTAGYAYARIRVPLKTFSLFALLFMPTPFVF